MSCDLQSHESRRDLNVSFESLVTALCDNRFLSLSLFFSFFIQIDNFNTSIWIKLYSVSVHAYVGVV